MTEAEVELERARRLFAQKIDRLRTTRDRFKKVSAEVLERLDAVLKNVEHDLVMCLAAAEDIQDDKEQR